MGIELHQIVTFASDVFGGNPVFVLVAPDRIDPGVLQQVATQLREPVLAAISTAEDTLRLSFVSPTGPHPGAGHTAHAAAHVALTYLRPRQDHLDFMLDDGRKMPVARDDHGPSVEWPILPYNAVDLRASVAECIGVEPLNTYSAAFGLVAVIDSSEDLARLTPDLEAIERLEANTLIVTARDDGGDFAIRVFAPRAGLPEDPVCGTAHRIIVPFWSDRLGKRRMLSRQLSPRGGRLYCALGDGTVTIGGAATPFFSGHIHSLVT